MALHLMSPLCWRKTSSRLASGRDTLIPWVCSTILQIESIILFQSADSMQHATCCAIKATVLHEEGIAIRAPAPSKTHVRAYMTAAGCEPSQTNLHP